MVSRLVRQSDLSEQLIMRAGSLECGDLVVRPPDQQPVASIGDMAFVGSEPLAFQRAHAMPALQLA